MSNNSSVPQNGTGFQGFNEFYNSHTYTVTIDRVVTPFFYVIGLPANPISAYIWLNKKTRKNNSSAIYLGSLSISHTVFLLFHILQELRYAWDIKSYDGYVTCEIFMVLFTIPQYLPPLLVLGFTVERYIAICHPFIKERYCTNRRAVLVVGCLLIFCTSLALMQAYFWTYDEQYQHCNHRPEVRHNPLLVTWTWLTELSLFGVSPLAALIFNVLVIREIHSLTSRGPAHTGNGGGSQTSTMTLLSVSFYLICTWLPYTIVYSLSWQFPIGNHELSYSQVEADPVWRRHFLYKTISVILTEITLSNSACYFFIYYATGKHFRKSVHKLFCGSNHNRSNPSKQYEAVSLNSQRNGTSATLL